MARRNWALAVLCAMMILVFGYAFWIGSQKSPELGGPAPISR